MIASGSRKAAICAALLVAFSLAAAGAPAKFYDDDPMWIERDHQDASQVKPWKIDLVTNVLLNLFALPGDRRMDVRAQNVNTVDEVPDSSWFTNRIGRHPVSLADLVKGPDQTAGPAPGQWTVTASKSDGVTPGFTIRDQAGQVWFLKFDPPGYRGMATGTEVAVTKLMWALGYFVSENHIASLQREQLVIGEGAKFTPPGGNERAMRITDIDTLLSRANRDPDGSYRIVASKALDGTIRGGFRFYDTRPDDPNDIVPHEHRRELRGYLVFSAWLNQFDANAINSMDTLVPAPDAPGRKIVRHNLLDFGSTLGSGGAGPRQYWEGHELLIEPRRVRTQMLSFGFAPSEWRSIDLYEADAIGRLPRDNTRFDPEQWRPRVPNSAFQHARADDKFWAARRVAAFSNGMLQAAVGAGKFGDPEAEAFLVRALGERRDAIARAYLPAVNPIVDPVLSESGTLSFRNAAVDAGVSAPPSAYRARWSAFDNGTQQARFVAETAGPASGIAMPGAVPTNPSAFVKIELSSQAGPPAWQRPIHVYFRRLGNEWRFVGLDRLPED